MTKLISHYVTKKAFLAFFSILAVLTIMYACRKNSNNGPTDVPSNLNFTNAIHKIDYKSTVSDSVLHFSLQIYKNGNNSMQINETFEINLRKDKLNREIYRILAEKSTNPAYSNLSTTEVKVLCNSIKTMIHETVNSLSPKEIKEPKVQGLYMSLSFVRRILNNKLDPHQNINRDHLLKSDVHTRSQIVFNQISTVQPAFEQDVYEGYDLGISPFVLNEDILVNKSVLLSVIAQELASMPSDTKGLYVFQAALNNMTGRLFTLKDLLRELDNYRVAHPELINGNGWWPNGSDHGCCGNYSGPCWYWHPYCWIHDKICRSCKPRWFCFGGCIPDSYETGDPKPFILVEDVEVPVTPDPILTLPVPLPSLLYLISDPSIVGSGHEKEHFLSLPVFYNISNSKYYADANFQFALGNGNWILEEDFQSGKYYQISNGKVVAIGYTSGGPVKSK